MDQKKPDKKKTNLPKPLTASEDTSKEVYWMAESGVCETDVPTPEKKDSK